MDRDGNNVPQGQHTSPEVAAPTVDTPYRVPAGGPEPSWTTTARPPAAIVGAAPLDEAAIPTSLAVVETALRRASDFRDLQRSYDRLLSAYFGLRRRVAGFQHDLNSVAHFASPFVQFVQHKYSVQADRLRQSQQQCAELRGALQERLDNANELFDLRSHLAYREHVHADAIASFEETIDDLNRCLAAASAARAQPTSGTHPQLQARLNAALAAHEAAVRDLDDAL
ncbi:unnamed protein product [Phytophthora fragariaefolia]|uniref:Unnamed protein product n=1 Tax=Phytophthora fragariaefolia TaxID=1490495 RepID=A0A9W6TP25_9STRA|nr:unnamed protein product [Phytophthora fragariaefolia]